MKTTHSALTVAILALCAATQPIAAQGAAPRPQPIPARGTIPFSPDAERKMLADVKVPDGFKVTLFAGPPVAMYPACITESPDGAIFVCVDPNLSLSQMKGVGRVMRLVDTDGDGHADSYTTFAEMDSPRGIVSDGRSVYVMHPPFLTAYRDTNGDGIADTSVDIVTGLGFDLNFRGADHTTNNIQLGADGWIYVAVGDYGFMNARGTDGRVIKHRGGAVVRVRPDGTQLEIVADGTRNMYDIAIDPLMHIFSRDNTNDGDGWDTRLHYLPAGAYMGYPSRYQNFGTEHFPSLADYGAGAGVGSVWLQDASWPTGSNDNLYTGDWTTQRIYRHALAPKGGIFSITQDEFMTVPRPADIIVDGSSNMYVASLAGGQFNYVGDTVGYVIQIRPTSRSSTREASTAKASTASLMAALGSSSAVQRVHAQQELLRRGSSASFTRTLATTIGDARKSVEERASAMFTLKQLTGAKANATLAKAAMATEPRIRETALRLLADRLDQLSGVSPKNFTTALTDVDPQVQIEGIRGLVRLDARGEASSLIPLITNADQAISHLAINALASLGGLDAARTGLDGNAEVRRASLRVLAMMYNSAATSAVIDKLGRTTDAAVRFDLLHTLGRMSNREGEWKGDWWTTRPAHAGPYYDPQPWEETPRIRAALASALNAQSGTEFTEAVADLMKNQALPRGSLALLNAMTVERDPMRGQLIGAMVGHPTIDDGTFGMLTLLDAQGFVRHGPIAQMLAASTVLPSNAVLLARSAVLDHRIDAATRGALLNLFAQLSDPAGLDAAVRIFAQENPAISPAAAPGAAAPTADPTEAAWRRFVGDRRRTGELDNWITLARSGEPVERTLAYAVLIQNVRSPRTPQPVREKVAPALDAAWADPVSAASLAYAIGVMRLESQYADKLAAYNLSKPK